MNQSGGGVVALMRNKNMQLDTYYQERLSIFGGQQGARSGLLPAGLYF